MTFIATPNTVHADLMFVLNGQQVHNGIYCKRDAVWTEAQRDDLATALATWWVDPGVSSYFYNGMTLNQIDVTNQDSQSSPKTTYILAPPSPGTGGAAMAGDNATALVATLRTASRGRSYRGRFYWAGHRSSAFQDGIKAVTGQLSGIILVMDALKTAIDALGAVWVIVSKYTNKAPRAFGLTTPVTAVSVDQYWDAQRRRLGLRGT